MTLAWKYSNVEEDYALRSKPRLEGGAAMAANATSLKPEASRTVLTTVSRNAGMQEILAIIERDGGVIVEDMIDAETLRRLNTELDESIASTAPGSRTDDPLWKTFHGQRTVRFTRIATRSKTFVELLLHPMMLAWADHALLPNCGSYWLNTGQMMMIGPGEPAQMLHRDNANWPFFSQFGPKAPEVTVSCMFALSDFTDEVGATRVIPGSHLWPDYTVEGHRSQTVGAVMKAGSGLMYSGRVIHGAGANRTTDRFRRGLHVSYVLGWLTPEEASPLGVPWEIARELPNKARRLLGYESYDPAPHYGGRLWLVDFEDAAKIYR
jgi:ectoine hydroxylase-related dioxygenase (phytanoyl-CoA dioxygenase family)